MKPLVSVICIAYNHAPYVQEALHSLFEQTYAPLEIIVLDDASKDNSVENIERAIEGRSVKTVFHTSNRGYTKTFNQGLAMSTGQYIIDFALDDRMKPDFIEESIKAFEQGESDLGVVFSNGNYVDAQGNFIANHTEELLRKHLMPYIPSGEVFHWVLRRYFICTPTMVVKREVFDRLGGYDETLAYEDFDFWVRSSRFWQYRYVDKVLIEKRKLANSMSSQRYAHHLNEQMNSVFKVCEKAFQLCKSKEDFGALAVRLNYEYRQCFRSGHLMLASQYRQLMREAGVQFNPVSYLARWVNRVNRKKIRI
ncbi:glycosyltransferase [Roseivirga sp. UBA838]|uniref:glycosyltransferase family 2 protein n=1 Tax=Roseivirga sp. UBA838 TaxID=1947393 RepID=UPI0025804A2D|nr:glycosyltransferase [Roseivirga sp. UBA838]|tara:strand:- start:667 stop:1593 length:927 start_codon:yes stop_codon:yes gene_type:complete